jgi:predicted transcriptional regulator
MTNPTTLKLPQSLKTRIAALAKDLDKTPHAFMVEALAAQTEQAELRHRFVAAALTAEQEVAERGLVHDADDVFAWMREKFAAKLPRRPRARSSAKHV